MSLEEKIFAEKYSASMQSYIEAYFEMIQDINVVTEKVMKKFSISRLVAEAYVKRYMPAEKPCSL